MDKIIIKNLLFKTKIGIYRHEEKKQPLMCDVELFTNLNSKKIKDDINKTIDYDFVVERIRKIINSNKFKLIESLAEFIANDLLKELPINKIKVHIKKPEAIKNAEYAEVIITRKK